MKRLLVLLGVPFLLCIMAMPVLAADGLTHNGRVLAGLGGDVGLPAGEQAEAVVVVGGHASVSGDANAVVVIDGTATLSGATVENLVVLHGSAQILAGTAILGDVRTIDASVTRADGTTVEGAIRGLEGDLVAAGWLLGAGALLLWLGVALATLIAGLTIAALAARQVRSAGQLIAREPGRTVLAGLGAAILTPIVAILALVTIVGAPLGFGLLVFLSAVAFVGYLVAAIWIGDVLLRVLRGPVETERPYLASVVGLLAAAILGVIPLLAAVISLFGLGAVVLATWRTFRGRAPAPVGFEARPAPMG